jgi:acyl-CoA reductase-like NAD-dependent aldehyde dehydrogenase
VTQSWPVKAGVRNRDAAKQIAARLEAGTVWINGHGGIHPMISFGGAKHSGYGLEFGVDGLKSVAVPQVISGKPVTKFKISHP